MLCIQNGAIHDAVHPEPYVADLWIEDGKIRHIGADSSLVADEYIDAGGLNVYPGYVDCHSHIGMGGYGSGKENKDSNEFNEIISPQLRGIDGIKAMDASFRFALEAGVTTMATGPGSSNVLGGTFVAIKPVGRRADDMVIKDPVAMKCAFGENVKLTYDKKCVTSRMTIAAKLRETLQKAREYAAKVDAAGEDAAKRPPYDARMEALLPVIHRELPLKAHAHSSDDIFTAIRIAKEFDLKLTLEHVTDGHLVADLLAQEGYPVAVGPTLGNASKYELRNMSWTTPGVLARAGCQVSIITDAPVTPEQYLPICAGFAVKAGMDPFDALQAITLHPAMHLGLEDRIGSIEVGKDANLVINDGSPFEIATTNRYVLIEGRVEYRYQPEE